jgi:hypothetical protein
VVGFPHSDIYKESQDVLLKDDECYDPYSENGKIKPDCGNNYQFMTVLKPHENEMREDIIGIITGTINCVNPDMIENIQVRNRIKKYIKNIKYFPNVIFKEDIESVLPVFYTLDQLIRNENVVEDVQHFLDIEGLINIARCLKVHGAINYICEVFRRMCPESKYDPDSKNYEFPTTGHIPLPLQGGKRKKRKRKKSKVKRSKSRKKY